MSIIRGMVRFGVDELLRQGSSQFRGQRIGLVTSNVATIAATGETSRVALRKAGFDIVRLFGPEHALGGVAADGAPVKDEVDPATLLPVVSLYGQKVRPPRHSLEDLDLVMFDIPDVGARFDTYIWTLSHLMEACAEARKPVYVLDRPNPIGGDLASAEGPGLDEANLSSFVGRWNIPVRYSLTIGELARLWNAERQIHADLHVVPVEGWRRDQHWPETKLKFVRLSPAMPSYETALLYPGTCLFEGTKLSEGRGTDAPFRLIGAPWVHGRRISDAFNALNLPGVVAHPAEFVPDGRKYAGVHCGGVRLESTDPQALRPVKTALHLVALIRQLYAEQFEWLPYPTAANKPGLQHFDRLIGRLDIRPAIDAGRADADQIESWTDPGDWTDRVRPYLLYE